MKMAKEKAKKQSKTASKTEKPAPKTVKSVSRYLRIGPRKIRLIIDTVRYKHPEEAFKILMGFRRKSARLTEKVLKSAVANAKDLGLDESRLYISDIRADVGPIMKRFIARSMGRGDRILKRTTHLSLTLKEDARKRWESAASEVAEEEKEGTSKKTKKTSAKKKKTAGAGKS